MNRLEYLFLIICCCFALGSSPAMATGDCSDFVDLTGMDLPIAMTGTTADATGDYGPFAEEPSCWNGAWDANCAAGRDVTYKWTVPHDGRYTITLFGTSTNADLLLYNFTCPAEPLFPDDFICGSHRSSDSYATVWDIELQADKEILIVVDGWLIWGGDYTLRIYDTTTMSDLAVMGIDLHQFAGLTAASVWRETGRWCDEVGLAHVPGGVPVQENHLFSMGGPSRVVTGTAVMQLWEDGHIVSLDDDVSDYLPFTVRNPNHPDAPITFRMLLSHTSSIQDQWGTLYSLYHEGEDSPISICELAEGWLTPGGAYYGPDRYAAFEPGSSWLLTRVGITLLACLVEHINPEGLSFEGYCREHILDPLGMTSSTFLLANVDPADLVTRHYWNGEEFVPLPVVTGPWYPAEFLRSNGREMSRLLLAYMNGGELYGERILEAATIDTMFTIHYPDASSRMGLIWALDELEGESVWRLSNNLDTNFTGIAVNLDRGTGVVGATNTTGGSGFSGIWDIFLDLLHRAGDNADGSLAVPDAGSTPPTVARLEACYPNPFNPRTSIRFAVPVGGQARLTVYDLRGRLVTTLLDEPVPAGRHTVIWDGRNGDGREAPSGVYFSRLEAGGEVAFGMMALVR